MLPWNPWLGLQMQFDRLKRREFIAFVGGAAAMWPLAARAQQGRTLPTVGFLGAGTPATAGPWVAVFTQRLRELGWIEDRTINIDLRWAEGRKDRSAEIAAEFVRFKVDVIATYSTEHAIIAKQATATIPIIATLLGDPLGTGLVTSLARPGGNLTGLSAQNVDLAGKRFELLREVVPALHRLAILFNVNNPNSALEIDILRRAARPLGLDVLTSEIRPAEDIAPAFAAIKAAQADAVLVVGDPLTFVNRTRIHTLALTARLPTVHVVREFVEAGGLISYGPNYPDLFRRAAEYVDKILRGAKPGDLPVEQPTKFDLVINLTTAKALDLTIPESFLLRADEVIE
jgi:putative ABC transport system substrate-binding protein